MSLGRKLSIIALLYVIEGFPMGVFRDLWPVYFRREGMSRADIGLVSGFILFWSLKVFWSPLVARFGEERRWIAACLLVMAGSLVLIPGLDASRLGLLLAVTVAGYCAASATQDIAIDAYTIRLVDRGQEGPANSGRITGYRLGLILSGGFLLLLPDRIGYQATFSVAAGLSVLMAIAVFTTPPLPSGKPAADAGREWMRRWAARPGVVPVAAFILLYRLGDIAMGPQVKPFWVDRGFSDDQIGVVSGMLGIGAFLIGAVIGGAVVTRLGIGRALWLLGALALLSNFGYVAAALLPAGLVYPVYAASLLESFCAGLASNAFMSFLMNITEKEHAAVQYALLTAIYALPGIFAGTVSGYLVEAIGDPAYFALTGILALPAFAFLPRARRWITAPGRPAG